MNSRGERVLDLYGGHAVAALGYGHPGWTEALTAQARSCNFQTNAIPMRIRVRAAERLVRFSKLDFTSVFFVNSGAEANENALRLAFRMTSRPHVAAVEGGFHGRTTAAGAVTWGSDSWYGFPRKPFDVSFMPRGDLGGHRCAGHGAHGGSDRRAGTGSRRRGGPRQTLPRSAAPPLR